MYVKPTWLSCVLFLVLDYGHTGFLRGSSSGGSGVMSNFIALQKWSAFSCQMCLSVGEQLRGETNCYQQQQLIKKCKSMKQYFVPALLLWVNINIQQFVFFNSLNAFYTAVKETRYLISSYSFFTEACSPKIQRSNWAPISTVKLHWPQRKDHLSLPERCRGILMNDGMVDVLSGARPKSASG